MDGLQHEAIAAQGDDDLSVVEAGVAVAGDELVAGLLGLGPAAGDECEAGDEGFSHRRPEAPTCAGLSNPVGVRIRRP
jgi:hypothetical protein